MAHKYASKWRVGRAAQFSITTCGIHETLNNGENDVIQSLWLLFAKLRTVSNIGHFHATPSFLAPRITPPKQPRNVPLAIHIEAWPRYHVYCALHVEIKASVGWTRENPLIRFYLPFRCAKVLLDGLAMDHRPGTPDSDITLVSIEPHAGWYLV